MLQIVQYQKTGEVSAEELPAPVCKDGGILVQTYFSLISAGTEKISVENAQASLIQRARKQPDQVKLVMDSIKKEGIVSTARRVKSKLESYKPLGYSASGIVIESKTDGFMPGDRVAVAGAGYANHAEILSIPKNLAVKIPENVTFEDAAYTTLGSIAMQGVRQADLRLGENVAVVGLGLLGQITVQLLKASGCRVVGLDINEALFSMAKDFGCDKCYPSSFEYVKDILAFTDGIGCDAVIITASTSSNQPMELALELARKKGRIVVVGAVGMNVPRGPFYVKELELTISCSYGPGRYDPNYEERGEDYPPAYVRWTENRNMQAFLELISSGSMNVKAMNTHTFDVKEATKAYDLITGKTDEKFLGVLISYPLRKEALKKSIIIGQTNGLKDLKIGFIGAGTFAQGYLLPNISSKDVDFVACSTETPVNAQSVAEKYGFAISTTDSSELIKNKDVNTVFCATRHDTHAKYVIEAVKAGKAIFVEKPLAATEDQLGEIKEQVKSHNGRVFVGFNRRFSKPFTTLKEFFSQRTEPLSMHYRVNAGKIPKSHWAMQPEHGGGRIVGEACHFIDCMVYLCGSLPKKVYTQSISTSSRENMDTETSAITVKFGDGSFGVLEYFANGDSSYPKEYFEAFSQGSIGVMHNFTSVELVRGGKTKIHKFNGSKGHKEEVRAFLESVKSGRQMPISFDEIYYTSAATFAAMQSMMTGNAVDVEEFFA
jgi:predicted dehydrogenase